LGDWEIGRLGDWETGRLGDWVMKRLGDIDWHADVTDSLMRSADDSGFF
jgi:hypothetical protein